MTDQRPPRSPSPDKPTDVSPDRIHVELAGAERLDEVVCIEHGPDDTFPVGVRYAELYSLSVTPQLRNRGIGTRLLVFVDRELARRSIYDLKVAVMEGNADARRLYERRGLRPAEVVLYRFGSPDRLSQDSGV